MGEWLSWALIVIALITTLLGVAKDVFPAVPKWLVFTTAAVTACGGILQFYQNVQGQNFAQETQSAIKGIPVGSDAPRKELTDAEQVLYKSLKEEASRFRTSKIKLFFSPSIDANALYRLGLLAFNQRDPAEAEMNLKYALQLDPGHIKAFNLLLQLYQSEAMKSLQRSNYDEAKKYLDEAQRLVADSDVEGDIGTMTRLGAVYKSLGQVNEALGNRTEAEQYWQQAGKIFERLLKRAPKDPSILVGMGNVLHHKGKLKEALEKYQAALAAAPNYTAAANDAAIACTNLMQEDSEHKTQWQKKACGYWDTALSLSEHDPQFDENYRVGVRKYKNWLCELGLRNDTSD
jgi:tetratricopeptide (TPR) repeat protein